MTLKLTSAVGAGERPGAIVATPQAGADGNWEASLHFSDEAAGKGGKAPCECPRAPFHGRSNPELVKIVGPLGNPQVC